MRVIKGLDLKKVSQGKTTPLSNFRVDPKDSNIKQCQSWNDYVMYQIKGTSKNGKPFAIYEVVKVMRKREGNQLHVYVIDRLYRTNDVVSACKYMNNLRRRILPTETQKAIVRAHKDQYLVREKKFPSGKSFKYVALKYPESVQRVADSRKGGSGGNNNRSSYRRGNSSSYRKGGYHKSANGNHKSPF